MAKIDRKNFKYDAWLDDGADGAYVVAYVGQAKSRPTKVGLAPGEVPQCRLQLRSYQSLSVSLGEMLVPKGQFMFPTH